MGVKWGVLGTANIARGCTIPGMKMAADCELYAIAGRDAKKVEQFRSQFGFEVGYTGYEKLLEDPKVQAVYIPLPNHLHKEWVIKALRTGKHVLCEKPLGLSADEVEEMFGVAKEEKVLLMEAYAYLHSPYIAALKRELQSGCIGEVDYIETAFLTQGYEDDIRIYKETGGGAVYDLGCYCTTMILTLTDSIPSYVMANAEINENGADIFASAIMKMQNGIRAAFTVGMMLGVGTDARKDRLYIHGSKGCINSSVEYNQQGILRYKVTSNGNTHEKSVEAGQNYALEIEQMNRCILQGEQPHISEAFSVKNAKVLDLILEKIGY
ncbi:MAG: Gfo/Idh/MocA family oxidoreductase [Lachnospiraceae bacterium]|nr:Gfo/Idh/MocA family oxidoreductase [Lachnospiraceae bacterium]